MILPAGICANVFTSPLPKFQMTNEVGLNVTEGFPGPFYNLSLDQQKYFWRIWKIFRFRDFLVLKVFIAQQNKMKSTQVLNRGQSWHLFFHSSSCRPARSFKRRMGIYNPNTVVRSGFNFTNRPEYHTNKF
jgi:outer membrane protein insertion porin family